MIGKIKYIREGKSQMELNREEDARFLVHHQVTEKKLLHLEKGVRKLGFQSGGNRILAGLLMASVMGLAIGLVFDGMVARTFSAIAVVLFLIFAAGVYSIFKAWFDAKKTIHLQYEAGKKDMNYDWEYRFLTIAMRSLERTRRPGSAIPTWAGSWNLQECWSW